MKRKLLFFLIAQISFFAHSQIVDIPDANFKNALVNSVCVDTDGDYQGDDDVDTNNDGEIQISEALVVTWYLDIHDQNIASLEGIGSFVNLERLGCWKNQLTNLDLSSNINLERLYCNDNQLYNINLSQNVQLDYLQCDLNQLTSLDLTQNINLEKLFCSSNKLNNIHLSQNIHLDLIFCNNNQLTQLDIHEAPNLATLHCRRNQLNSLNLDGHQSLTRLYLEDNNLTMLDLSQNTSIGLLDCSRNPLTFLNLKNGEETPFHVNTLQNPNLFCIQVDDENKERECLFDNEGWCQDSWTEYSEECILGVEEFEENKIVTYPNPARDVLHIEMNPSIKIESIKIYNVVGEQVFFNTEHNQTLEVSTLKSGIYFLQIKSKENIFTKKFLKE